MSTLANGKYRTAAGSTVEISGEHGGISTIDFDWFEEDACFDCEVQPYPEQFGEDDWRLVWNCEYCSGGNAELIIEK